MPGRGQAATTYYVKVTYLVNGGETAASSESSLAVAASHLLQVSSPSAETGATAYNVYVWTTSGQEVLQNANPITLGSTWTEPTSGLVTGASAPLTGKVPDGTETIANIQSLSRSYSNAAGHMVRSDAYFNLSGVTYSTSTYIGTQNTNYYTTTYDYDHRGREDKTVSPTGTINRTVFDSLGRTVSTWVGTNDTPSSGEWSPTNNGGSSNMIQVSSSAYDTTTNPVPSAPSLSQTSGGTMAATTYFVKIAYVFGGPAGVGSAESSLAVSANNLLRVASPASAAGATGYNVYVATTS